jgi:hypothetical protein
MKTTISNKLYEEGYKILLEPLYSPLKRLSWIYFRPDILGILERDLKVNVVFAECETNPSVSRVKAKTKKVKEIFLQKLLGEIHVIRLILAIPCGMFFGRYG